VVAVRPGAHERFAGGLAGGIRAHRLGRHALGFGQHLVVTIRAGAGGEHDALNFRFNRRLEDVERAGDVDVMEVARLLDAVRHRTERRLMKDVTNIREVGGDGPVGD
jgi:hypothetical protein